jgi:hypothetical protein
VKFVHKFSRSLSCQVVVCDEPPEKGQTHVQSVEWIGQPKRKYLPEYLRFCHVMNRHLADQWQMSILQLVQTPPSTGKPGNTAPASHRNGATASTSIRRALKCIPSFT